MRALTACLIFMCAGCASQGALTPEEAYYSLRAACIREDAPAVEKLLSKNSIKRIETVVSQIARLEGARAEGFAREMKTAPEALKALTVTKFIALQLSLEKAGTPQFVPFLRSKPKNISINEKSATIVNENGIMMKLVKEGPYWKFEESFF